MVPQAAIQRQAKPSGQLWAMSAEAQGHTSLQHACGQRHPSLHLPVSAAPLVLPPAFSPLGRKEANMQSKGGGRPARC